MVALITAIPTVQKDGSLWSYVVYPYKSSEYARLYISGGIHYYTTLSVFGFSGLDLMLSWSVAIWSWYHVMDLASRSVNLIFLYCSYSHVYIALIDKLAVFRSRLSRSRCRRFVLETVSVFHRRYSLRCCILQWRVSKSFSHCSRSFLRVFIIC